MTNVELYEALKGSIPDKAARLIAEIFPHTRELVTKSDFHELKDEFGKLRVEFAEHRAQNEKLHSSMLRWIIGMFVPVWLGTWATVVAVILKA